MTNKKIILVTIIVVLMILSGGGYYLMSSKKTPTNSVTEVLPQPTEEPILTLSAEDIGLSLTAGFDKKRAIVEVTNTDDITSLDYELSYISKGNIPRGVIGHIDVKLKGKKVLQEIILGTCSDVCHYDQEVSDIKLILKVNKTDNKVYSVEKSFTL